MFANSENYKCQDSCPDTEEIYSIELDANGKKKYQCNKCNLTGDITHSDKICNGTLCLYDDKKFTYHNSTSNRTECAASCRGNYTYVDSMESKICMEEASCTHYKAYDVSDDSTEYICLTDASCEQYNNN